MRRHLPGQRDKGTTWMTLSAIVIVVGVVVIVVVAVAYYTVSEAFDSLCRALASAAICGV